MSGNPRSSRGKSPLPLTPAATVSTPAGKPTDASGGQGTLDRWIEPSLAPPRPSFAEAGHTRQGVVKGMEALGTRPSAKAMKMAATIEAGGFGRKSDTPSLSTPNEGAYSIDTPEPTSADPVNRSSTPGPSGLQSREVASRASSIQRDLSQPPIQNTISGRSSATPAPISETSSAALALGMLSRPPSVTPSAARPKTPSRSATPNSTMATQVMSVNTIPGMQGASVATMSSFDGSADTPMQDVDGGLIHDVQNQNFVYQGMATQSMSGPPAPAFQAAPLDMQDDLALFTTFTNAQVPPQGEYSALLGSPMQNLHTGFSDHSNSHQNGIYGFSSHPTSQTPQTTTSHYPQTFIPESSRPHGALPQLPLMQPGQSVFSARPETVNPPQLPQQHQHAMPVNFTPPAPPMIFQGLPNIPLTMQNLERIVESATQQALDEQHYPTAYAIRTVFDEYKTNHRMVNVIKAVIDDSVDDSSYNSFLGVIAHRKKQGRKGGEAKYYFDGDGTDPPAPLNDDPSVLPPDYSTGTPGDSLPGSISTSETGQPSIGISPISPYTEADQHVSKKHKGNNSQASPIMKKEVNGNGAAPLSSIPNPVAAAPMNGGIRKTERSLSLSSSSSLSSVDEELVAGSFESPAHKAKPGPESHLSHANAQTQAQGGQGSPRIRNASTAETYPGGSNQSKPISGPKKSGPKLAFFSTVKTGAHSASTTPSSSATVQLSSSAKTNAATKSHQHQPSEFTPTSTPTPTPSGSMPSAVPSSTQTLSVPSRGKGRKEKESTPVVIRTTATDEARSQLKRAARVKAQETAGIEVESFERQPVSDGSDGGDFVPPPRSKNARLKINHTLPPKKTRHSQSQANHYESDASSPTQFAFHPELPPGRSVTGSRAGTPSVSNRLARKSKTGGGLRVKSSPQKNGRATTATGLPRANGEQSSPINGTFNPNQDDNDDNCNACSGTGELICCDGCPRAFHSKCIDPPISDDVSQHPDEWFCNNCQTARAALGQHEGAYNGTFGQLLQNIEKKNPISFSLPEDIRELFENVKTGVDGEYEEPVPPKPKNPKGYEEAPDYFKQRDSKGKIICCHNCGELAQAPDRKIIACTFCGLNWHLDCIDPPMAKEPAFNRPWKCPAHVDDLLAWLPEALAPAHRFRKKKAEAIIRPAITRGFKNNGHIEVDLEPSDDEADEEPKFFDQQDYGKIYKLPEQGIKLDFIATLKRKYGAIPIPSHRLEKRQKTDWPYNIPWTSRAIEEQQAALNIASLKIAREGTDITKSLTDALITQAPPTVLTLMAEDIMALPKESLEIMSGIFAAAIAKKAKDEAAAFSSGKSSELQPEAKPAAEVDTEISPAPAATDAEEDAEEELGADISMST